MPRFSPPRRYEDVDAQTLARFAEREERVTFDPRYFVGATALGPWAGSDLLDALARVRGELGAPHLSFLPSLADRGYAATPLARTIACLEGLNADGASFGWRIVSGYSREGDKARSLLASDINLLADTVGKETSSGSAFKVQLTGPLTLAASLYLPNGERAISDQGAVRDIRDSLIAGLGDWLQLVREAVPGEQLIFQFNDPAISEVLAGGIRTSSGFRTYRALPAHTAQESYQILANWAERENIQLALAGTDFAQLKQLSRSVHASVVPTAGLQDRDWENVAALVESGQGVWLETVPVQRVLSVPDMARRIWSSWRTVGLPASALSQVILCESGDLSQLAPAQATSLLGHLTETARALSEIAQGQ